MADHEHKFQREGEGWACFGWDDACGLRAPACFIPVESAMTAEGRNQFVAMQSEAERFVATHFMIVKVP